MSDKPRLSLEVFPPKTAEGETALMAALDRLAVLDPKYISVTYGAGGSTRDRSLGVVEAVVDKGICPVAAHLTCVSQTRAEVDGLADTWWTMGVKHIVALRGDVPGGAPYEPHPEGYRNGADLTRGLLAMHPFEVSVGAYPEKHPDSASLEACIANLKAKQDAGARRAITQFFFEADMFLAWRDAVRRAGIGFDLIPGIMPVANYAALLRFAKACEATIPAWMAARFEALDGDQAGQDALAVDLCADLCRRLWEEGCEQFHLYTLNKAPITLGVAERLGYGGVASAA